MSSSRMVQLGEEAVHHRLARYSHAVDNHVREEDEGLAPEQPCLRIPHVRLSGRLVRFERRALEAYIAARRVDID
jgi:hypothetical protein